ncbi:MAG TPA: hypothetical protein VKA47_08930 [Solirubrobacterales bacterium]|nr:hypothetical protein [Solirubrobacterales bacterium]
MSFEIPANPGDPGRPDTGMGRVDGAEAGTHRRLVRDGVQVLAHGALICPGCALPIAATTSFSAGSRLVCGYCDHVGPGRDFLAEDVYDTVANEVYLVARVA